MESMQNITSSSEQIAKIIKTIDEIAFQTNLLALNAAVEAARAGEHGLGFAVVAEEVKNLAGRSAKAAQETADIIETSIQQVNQGNTIAKETDEAFSDILDKIQKTSNLIGEIAISSKEQSEGMRQISQAMGQIDDVTQQNAAASEEAAAAAEELNAQATSMLITVAEVGKVVGIDIEADNNVSTTASHAPVHRQAPPKISPSLPSRATSNTRSTPASNDDIFPLGDDDLKEF
jgi:methyl-accepting chemotaxis protein